MSASPAVINRLLLGLGGLLLALAGFVAGRASSQRDAVLQLELDKIHGALAALDGRIGAVKQQACPPVHVTAPAPAAPAPGPSAAAERGEQAKSAEDDPSPTPANIQAFDSARRLLAEAEGAYRWNEEDVMQFRALLAHVTATQRDDLLSELITKRNDNKLPRTLGIPF